MKSSFVIIPMSSAKLFLHMWKSRSCIILPRKSMFGSDAIIYYVNLLLSYYKSVGLAF